MRGTKRRLLIIAAVVGLGVVSAQATIFMWRNQDRPPLSLEEALERAELALGEEAEQRYCVEFFLVQGGPWNLLYGAADGSSKLVDVNMDGTTKVAVWDGPLGKTDESLPAHASLDELHQKLVDFFEKESLDVDFQVGDDQLIVQYRPRQFRVHKRLPDGAFSNEMEEVTGPQPTGLLLTIRETAQPYAPDDFWAPYWSQFKGTYYTARPDHFFLVEMQRGTQFKRRAVWRLESVIGELTPRLLSP